MSNTKTYKQGSISPFSGEAEAVGSRGGRTGHQVTVDKGERFPPAKKGQVYIKGYGAHNKAGKGK